MTGPIDHREQGRDNGVQELEFLCVERWRPRQDQTPEVYDLIYVGDSDDRRKRLKTV